MGIKPVNTLYRLGVAAVVCVLPLALGCGAVETPEELQTLAGGMSKEKPAEAVTPSPSAPVPAASADLDGFPLVGSVFPGLGGRLHSALCDPVSDPYSTCI